MASPSTRTGTVFGLSYHTRLRLSTLTRVDLTPSFLLFTQILSLLSDYFTRNSFFYANLIFPLSVFYVNLICPIFSLETRFFYANLICSVICFLRKIYVNLICPISSPCIFKLLLPDSFTGNLFFYANLPDSFTRFNFSFTNINSTQI